MKKDCDCTTHQGPHWLHMDYLQCSQNIEHCLVPALNYCRSGNVTESLRFLEAYGQTEYLRLCEKAKYMKEGESYPYTLLGNVPDLHARAIKMLNEISEITIQSTLARVSDEDITAALPEVFAYIESRLNV